MKAKFAVVIAQTSDLAKIRAAMVAEAQQVHLEKKATDEAMGRFGLELMPSAKAAVMTQCNAGALATAGIGTALGVFRVAVEQGKNLHVLVPETRPYLQGARLTAWELHKGGISADVDHRQYGRPLLEDGLRPEPSSPAPTASPRMATRRTKSARIKSPYSRKKTTSRFTSPRRFRPSICRFRTAAIFLYRRRSSDEVVAPYKNIRIARPT